MHNFVTRQPRGFGFVAYSKRSSVDKLLEQQYYVLNGRRIEVKLAVPRERLAQQEAEEYTMPSKPRAGATASSIEDRPAEYNDGYAGMAGTDGHYMYSMEQEPGNVVIPVYSYSAEQVMSPIGPNAYPTGIPVQLGIMPPPMAPAVAATGQTMLGPAHASPFMCAVGYPPGFGAPPMYQCALIPTRPSRQSVGGAVF
jgi:hypothetical protein